MVSIKKWNDCKTRHPKKGKYLLMYCETCLNWSNIYINEVFWNGHMWCLEGGYTPMKWKYITTDDKEKYGY